MKGTGFGCGGFIAIGFDAVRFIVPRRKSTAHAACSSDSKVISLCYPAYIGQRHDKGTSWLARTVLHPKNP
jgi:hypothetical protein